ncbi:MAG: FkbM family methyltransferase [Bacteroidetes bacterium]|nr:FkbM family methyltransferase [Bacteroidota bacterium]
MIALSTFMNHPSIFVDVLKIDVEGHEYDCLLGLFQNNKGISNKIPPN